MLQRGAMEVDVSEVKNWRRESEIESESRSESELAVRVGFTDLPDLCYFGTVFGLVEI